MYSCWISQSILGNPWVRLTTSILKSRHRLTQVRHLGTRMAENKIRTIND